MEGDLIAQWKQLMGCPGKGAASNTTQEDDHAGMQRGLPRTSG